MSLKRNSVVGVAVVGAVELGHRRVREHNKDRYSAHLVRL
jgi:hypothetical protein